MRSCRAVAAMYRLMTGFVLGAVLFVAACDRDDDYQDDGVTTIFDSPECRAFCARLQGACPKVKCDPQSHCDQSGECLAEKRAALACKADPNSTDLTCNSAGGYSTAGFCMKPRGLCK